MDKEVFRKHFDDNLEKNFPALSKYFDFDLKVFSEFNQLIFEINKCLLLEFNRASITLTNNLLERLLKLALIYNETGIGPKPVENWNTIFAEPNQKYSSIPLGNSIERCRKNGLITDHEKTVLFDTIRELMRNGFSHADSSKILADLPDHSPMYQGYLNNPTDLKEVSVNQKVVPFLQAIQMEEFAKENAKPYFEYTFKLVFRIENRLIEKQKKTCI